MGPQPCKAPQSWKTPAVRSQPCSNPPPGIQNELRVGARSLAVPPIGALLSQPSPPHPPAVGGTWHLSPLPIGLRAQAALSSCGFPVGASLPQSWHVPHYTIPPSYRPPTGPVHRTGFPSFTCNTDSSCLLNQTRHFAGCRHIS